MGRECSSLTQVGVKYLHKLGGAGFPLHLDGTFG
jgi:hypothetical protein